MARGSLARLVVASGVALALVAPGGATAVSPIGGEPAGGLFYFAGSVSLPVSGNAGRLTVCSEPGTRTIGGAFDADAGSLDGLVAQTFPAGSDDADSKPDDGWYTNSINVSGSSTSMTSYAVCSFDPVKYRTATKSIGAGKTGTVKVTCPSGTREPAPPVPGTARGRSGPGSRGSPSRRGHWRSDVGRFHAFPAIKSTGTCAVSSGRRPFGSLGMLAVEAESRASAPASGAPKCMVGRLANRQGRLS
ncbi:MAG: hypothetical protein ABI726_10045 [bacterium]